MSAPTHSKSLRAPVLSGHSSSMAPVQEAQSRYFPAPAEHRPQAMSLSVNGRRHAIHADPETTLLRVLRKDLQLTGTSFACTNGQCSACTVHVNDRPTRSCRIPVHVVQGAEIVTIEGLAAREGLSSRELHAVQRAWIDEGVPECPCQAGMIMAAAALLMENPDPSVADIEAAIYLDCRCGIRPHVLRAVFSLAERLKSW